MVYYLQILDSIVLSTVCSHVCLTDCSLSSTYAHQFFRSIYNKDQLGQGFAEQHKDQMYLFNMCMIWIQVPQKYAGVSKLTLYNKTFDVLFYSWFDILYLFTFI